MNIAVLSTLAAILDKGSLAAAAQEIGCTPSAVSLQMKQLEAWFGRALFDRSSRSVKPTPFAHEAAAAAREIRARLEALRVQRTLAVAGQVRLGAISSVQTDFLPRALRLLRDRHPGLEVTVHLDDSSPLQAEVQAGRIDMAVVVRPPSGGSSRLLWQDLARQPFVLLAPPGAAGASPRELLREHALIGYDPALTGGRIAARYVARLLPKARPAMALRSIDAIVAMVAAGLGVSVVPRPRPALLDAHGVRAVGLGRAGPTRQIAALRRAADAESRNLEAVSRALVAASTGTDT